MLKRILIAFFILFFSAHAEEYECIDRHGDYRIVFKGTRDEAIRVSRKNYTSFNSCNTDLKNYLNGKQTPVEYECINRHGDYRIVFKGTRDEAIRVSRKNYTSFNSCNTDLKNYLNGKQTPVEYECINRHGDYRIVFKGTRDEALRVSRKNYTSFNSCNIDLTNYLNGKETPVEYECIDRHGDYRIVFKGTRDEALRVSRKNYTSFEYCNNALKKYLSEQ